MTKHTPAPWIISKSEDYAPLKCVIRAEHKWGIVVCALTTPLSDDEEREANARLIATAPELLEALKDVLREYGKLAYETNQPVIEPEAITAARAAIAKAEGK